MDLRSRSRTDPPVVPREYLTYVRSQVIDAFAHLQEPQAGGMQVDPAPDTRLRVAHLRREFIGLLRVLLVTHDIGIQRLHVSMLVLDVVEQGIS